MPSLIRKTIDEATSHSARLSAEELLAGHPKDDNQAAGYVPAPVRSTLMSRMLVVWSMVIVISFIESSPAMAEYGDVVINNYSDAAGMRPVIFPHWFHRIRFRCKVCHADLGFKFKAGGNDINMYKIIEGKYCGACHNGKVAWSVKNCILCHSGKPGIPIQIHESTMQELAVPTNPLTGKK
jgi:c(7)-type cytochrome triheme protein